MIVVLYWNVLSSLAQDWQELEEYSHGFLLPVLAGYLFWQSRDTLGDETRFSPSWWGTAIAFLALALLGVGIASFTAYFEKISLLLLLIGLIVARYGFGALPLAFVPLMLVFLSYPLPFFINAQLTSGMQLLSSELGVAIIRLMGIPVYLEGNVIDLGTYKMQVVEACSGLRYMFPLLSFSLVLACFFKVAMWKRVLVFLSAIPITILMNSVRIGVIGMLAEYRGISSADGFLHAFEGWLIFICCLLILFLVMLLITFRERRDRSLSDLLVIR